MKELQCAVFIVLGAVGLAAAPLLPLGYAPAAWSFYYAFRIYADGRNSRRPSRDERS